MSDEVLPRKPKRNRRRGRRRTDPSLKGAEINAVRDLPSAPPARLGTLADVWPKGMPRESDA